MRINIRLLSMHELKQREIDCLLSHKLQQATKEKANGINVSASNETRLPA